MPEPAFEPVSALEGLRAAGRHGRMDGEPGVVLTERADLAALVLLASPAADRPLQETLKPRGIELPAVGRWSAHRGATVIWTAPGQWLAVGPPGPVRGLETALRGSGAACWTVAADDARCLIGVSGPSARDTLAKVLPLDLHPRAFRPGDAAVTLAGGFPVTIWQTGEVPSYEVAVPRSYAASFWRWLTDSAAEYGWVAENSSAA